MNLERHGRYVRFVVAFPHVDSERVNIDRETSVSHAFLAIWSFLTLYKYSQRPCDVFCRERDAMFGW